MGVKGGGHPSRAPPPKPTTAHPKPTGTHPKLTAPQPKQTRPLPKPRNEIPAAATSSVTPQIARQAPYPGAPEAGPRAGEAGAWPVGRWGELPNRLPTSPPQRRAAKTPQLGSMGRLGRRPVTPPETPGNGVLDTLLRLPPQGPVRPLHLPPSTREAALSGAGRQGGALAGPQEPPGNGDGRAFPVPSLRLRGRPPALGAGC